MPAYVTYTLSEYQYEALVHRELPVNWRVESDPIRGPLLKVAAGEEWRAKKVLQNLELGEKELNDEPT